MSTAGQAHDGASIGWSGTLQVNYAYREMAGGANDSRLLQINYPNWRAITYSYGATDSLNDRIGRVEDLVCGNEDRQHR